MSTTITLTAEEVEALNRMLDLHIRTGHNMMKSATVDHDMYLVFERQVNLVKSIKTKVEKWNSGSSPSLRLV